MNLQEIKNAIGKGLPVYWQELNYKVIKQTEDDYLIKHDGGHCGSMSIGLTWSDGLTLNANEEDFFVLTQAQKTWLLSFIERWDKANDAANDGAINLFQIQYREWLLINNLPPISADELILYPSI
jgi:hypothetical protein